LGEVDQWNGIGKAWNQGLLEHGKEICSSFKSNEVIKIKSNRKSRNKSEKFSKKESSEIRDVIDLPPLEKSRPRDLVAQGTIANLPSFGNLLLLRFSFYRILFP
jgi:hypothetical protein